MMDKINDITIVIPVYNREQIVERTLESVFSQSYRPLNVILVDNNSSDDTYRVLADWCRMHNSTDFKVKLFSEHEPGASNARNRGLAEVSTKWTMFFDSDDVMLPDHVARAMSFVESHQDAEVVGWDKLMIKLDGGSYTAGLSTKDYLYENIMFSTMATQHYMAMTELFRRVGGWAQHLSMGDDVELGHRILKEHPVIYKIGGQPTVIVYETGVSITNSTVSRIRALQNYLDRIRELTPEICHSWISFKLLIMSATWAKDDPKSRDVAKRILKQRSARTRCVWMIFYWYARMGGRGSFRLYRFLDRKRCDWPRLS